MGEGAGWVEYRGAVRDDVCRVRGGEQGQLE